MTSLAVLPTHSRVWTVATYNRRYHRKIAETVLRWYTELEDGMIQSDAGPVFDSRILDYRVDVERVLGKFPKAERDIILLIHRDGCSQVEATRLAGVFTERPDLVVADIEARMGQAFDQLRLGAFLDYVGYLR